MKVINSKDSRRRVSRDDKTVENGSLHVDRRGFLLGGAAVIAGISSAAGNASAVPEEPAAGNYSVSAGYWLGSDLAVISDSSGAAALPERAIPISAVPPDSELLNSRGVTVRIHGIFGAAVDVETQRLNVIAEYSANSPAFSAPVYVWSHSTTPIAHSSSSAMFAMPINTRAGISLTLERFGKPGARESSSTASYVAALTARTAGVYFIALNALAPHTWSSYVFTRDAAAGGARKLLQRTLGGMMDVSFPYLMVSVAPIGIKTPLSY